MRSADRWADPAGTISAITESAITMSTASAPQGRTLLRVSEVMPALLHQSRPVVVRRGGRKSAVPAKGGLRARQRLGRCARCSARIGRWS